MSLRIFELAQLEMSDIDKIEHKKPINIKSKCKHGNRVVVLNDTLISVFKTIKEQRTKVLKRLKFCNRDFKQKICE
jgi:hypothetical protein